MIWPELLVLLRHYVWYVFFILLQCMTLTHSSFQEFLVDIAVKLELPEIAALFNHHGARIKDLSVLR